MESIVGGRVTCVVSWILFMSNVFSLLALAFGANISWCIIVVFLLFQIIFLKSFWPPQRPLTEQEKDQLCDEWVPEPLVNLVSSDMLIEPPVLERAAEPHTTIDGKEVVNFASSNYLGLIGHEKCIESCTAALKKYGVGSCGPRGFYGTIEEHLDCEARIANFLGTPESVLYSYGLSTMFSAIPAFAKQGDTIVVDEGVHWGIQNGLQHSYSKIVYFKHNDMESLRDTLETTMKNLRTRRKRRYIVVEAVYKNSGKVAPLDEIIKLKEKYKFRILLDESNSFGVLGRTGRGLTEQFGVPVEKIDIIAAEMGNALATEGGFCTGSKQISDHQRLNSRGYVFSASSAPYLATAAITAIDVLEENPELITKLKENIALLWRGLTGISGLSIVSDPESPIVFLKLTEPTGSSTTDLYVLQEIAERVLREDSVLVATSKRSTLDQCALPVGIRLFVSAGHTESDLLKVAGALKRVAGIVAER